MWGGDVSLPVREMRMALWSLRAWWLLMAIGFAAAVHERKIALAVNCVLYGGLASALISAIESDV